MILTLFILFLAIMTIGIVAATARYLGTRAAKLLLAGLCVWFAYVSLLAHSDVLRSVTMRPPGITFLGIPILIFLLISSVWLSTRSRIALAFPLWMILGTQAFRGGVELFLHQLWILGLIPKTLTFRGANVDIYIGVSAPLIAWLATRGRRGMQIAFAWNVLGLLALANVVIRAVLTTPGPLNLIHAEVPNRLLSTFPYLFVPAFFVPLAVVLHVLAMRAIVSRLRGGATQMIPPPTPSTHS